MSLFFFSISVHRVFPGVVPESSQLLLRRDQKRYETKYKSLPGPLVLSTVWGGVIFHLNVYYVCIVWGVVVGKPTTVDCPVVDSQCCAKLA